MKTNVLTAASKVLFLFIAATAVCADQVAMQNGDRYNGKVLSVSPDTVVLESEVLGRINVPRKQVASLSFGTNAAATNAATDVGRISRAANLPVVARTNQPAITNADLAAAFRNLGAHTNFVGQIREQMLSDSPEAANKYTEMVNGLMSGKLSMDDLRREAKSSADQLRALKRDLGPEVGDSLDMYLEVLDSFLKESGPAASTPKPASPSKTTGR